MHKTETFKLYILIFSKESFGKQSKLLEYKKYHHISSLLHRKYVRVYRTYMYYKMVYFHKNKTSF